MRAGSHGVERPDRRAADLLTDLLERLGLDRDAGRLEVHAPGLVAEAWCEPGVVHLRPPAAAEAFWRAGGLGRRMLAHEAAHLAQFAASAPAAPVLLLEAEADAVALRLDQGRAVRVRLGAAPGRLHWSRVGHYYTTYLIALVAGAPEQLAQRWALLSQIPDLVSELDATLQAEVQESLIGGDLPATELRKSVAKKPNHGLLTEDYEVCRDVIEGLHCLTGAPTDDERRRRIANTMGAKSELEFGISLHALGDAWAHCNGGVMYKHKVGHLMHWHFTDLVSAHPLNYIEYVDALFRILNVRAPSMAYPGAKLRLTLTKVKEKLLYMAMRHPNGDEEPTQIPYMQHMIESMSNTCTTYIPAYETVPWSSFVTSPANGIPRPALAADGLQTILGYARAWRHTPRDNRDPSARIAEARRSRTSQQATNTAIKDAARTAADTAIQAGRPLFD